MATLTIEDYKEMYAKARAAGDAAGMQVANDGANAIRAANGQAAQYATEDIAKIAAQSGTGSTSSASSSGSTKSTSSTSGYTTQNQSVSAATDTVKATQAAAAAQKQYVNDNPTATQYPTTEEKQSKYSDVLANVVQTGYYTKDAVAAQAAAEKYGVSVTPTTYNGESGWYIVGKADRTAASGTSGADEGLLSDEDYAIVQKLKSDFSTAQQQYKAAVDAGDTEAAAKAQAAMNTAHLEAERIRSGYSYSGGSDGSMYLTTRSGGSSETDADDGQTGQSASAQGTTTGQNKTSGSQSGVTSGYTPTVSQSRDLTGAVEDYSDYLRQLYAAKQDSAIAQLQAAYESSLAQLDRAEQGVSEQYQAARNSTAGASEQARRNFAQYAAASGLNSGTGGQAELARNVTLQSGLNAIDQAEADTLADLELQRTQAETQYNSAIAQAKAQGEYELASALYQEKVRVQKALLDQELEQQQLELKWYQAYRK
jgi:hypothetical protein